jgi:hypothetical protein
MPRRPRRPLPFKQTDLERAYRAAERVGMPNPRIEIRRDGTITVIPGDPPKDSGGRSNAWDEVLTNAEDAQRAS